MKREWLTGSIHALTGNNLSLFRKHTGPRRVMSTLDSVVFIQTVSNVSYELQIWSLLLRIT